MDANMTSTPVTKRSQFATILGVLTGFIPWAVYWVAGGLGAIQVALIGRLVVSAVQNGLRIRRRNYKTLELATLAYSVLDVAVTLIAGSLLLRTYGDVCVNGLLALMAFGSLAAGSPFTYQYAKESWPKEYWQDQTFRRTNEIITAVWGTAFLIACAGAGLDRIWPGHSGILLGGVPAAVNLLAALFSIAFPEWYPLYRMAQDLREAAPFSWEIPELGGPSAEASQDVVVIGAGIGGLSAAALLAQRGLRVLVLEQHALPGGYCSSWKRRTRAGTFIFDAGVHDVSGLGWRGPVRNLLTQLGVEREIEWLRVGHEYLTKDRRIQVPEEVEAYIELLADQFPSEREGIRNFFAEVEAVYRDMYADVERTGGVPRPPSAPKDKLAYPQTHPHLVRWYRRPFQRLLDTYISDPSLKGILSALSSYITDDPTELTVDDIVPLYGYFFFGGYCPKGGSQRLADALVAAIHRNGGQVQLKSRVRSIRVASGSVQGVETDRGVFYRAPVVISNADAKRALLELVGKEYLPRWFARRVEGAVPSASAFAVFLGVDFVPEIAPLGIVLGSVLVAVPSKVDPTLAPPGHASISLYQLVSAEESRTWDRSAPDYAERKRRQGDELITKAEALIPGLRDHIVFREEASPATFARYAGTTQGAIYGLARGAHSMPIQSPIRGLFMVGSGVAPGAGIEAVVISGTVVADTIRPPAKERVTDVDRFQSTEPRPLQPSESRNSKRGPTSTDRLP